MYRAGITEPRHVWGGCHGQHANVGGLDESTRKLIITVAVAEGILKVAALIDIKRRPASRIRGPTCLWARWWQ